jgi:hypothetical protein
LFCFPFLLGYIYCTQGIHCDNSEQPFIIYWLDQTHHLPPKPLYSPLKAITRSFIVLFHVSIWSPSTIFPHLHLFHSPSSLPQTPLTHMYWTYFAVLSFIISFKVNVQRGFSKYPYCEYTSLWSVQPLPNWFDLKAFFHVLLIKFHGTNMEKWLLRWIIKWPL